MENLNLLEVKKDFDNYLKDYENLKGKDLIYKGIEELLDNSELREKLFNECLEESKGLVEDSEWDKNMFDMIFCDRIDIKVMDWFFDKLVNNLLEKDPKGSATRIFLERPIVKKEIPLSISLILIEKFFLLRKFFIFSK